MPSGTRFEELEQAIICEAYDWEEIETEDGDEYYECRNASISLQNYTEGRPLDKMCEYLTIENGVESKTTRPPLCGFNKDNMAYCPVVNWDEAFQELFHGWIDFLEIAKYDCNPLSTPTNCLPLLKNDKFPEA